MSTPVIYSLGERKVEFHGDNWFIADNATVIGSVVLEQNVSIWFNAVVRADNDRIIIGENTNIQDGAILHTDPGLQLTIGRGVTVGHLAMLHGCTIGDNCLIGIKSLIMNRTIIGNNCLIGANTLITEGQSIPDGVLVKGSPGKIIRPLSDEEIERLRLSATHYVENLRRFKRDLRRMET